MTSLEEAVTLRLTEAATAMVSAVRENRNFFTDLTLFGVLVEVTVMKPMMDMSSGGAGELMARMRVQVSLPGGRRTMDFSGADCNNEEALSIAFGHVLNESEKVSAIVRDFMVSLAGMGVDMIQLGRESVVDSVLRE